MMDQLHPATFRDRVIPFLTGLILFLITSVLTLVFGVLAIASFVEQKSLNEWTTVPAIVEKSEVTKLPSGKNKFDLLYKYTVANQEYRSHRYHLFPIVSNKLVDESSFIEQHPVGSTITVHVDPAHPKHAFVNANPADWWVILPVLLGLFFLLMGVRMMWRSATAVYILKNRVNSGLSTGTNFYFFNSLEAATEARKWKSEPTTNSFRARTVAFLMALSFACIGFVGTAFLILENRSLPGVVMAFACIILPGFAIMGACGLWRCITAKYVIVRKNGLGQEEISFYDDKDVRPKADSTQS